MRVEVRHAREGAPDSLQDLSGAPPDSQAGPQDRASTVEPQRSADVASIRLSLGSSPNSELIDREKQPKLEPVKTFILGTNANSKIILDL